jgi:hypothetical protein
VKKVLLYSCKCWKHGMMFLKVGTRNYPTCGEGSLRSLPTILFEIKGGYGSFRCFHLSDQSYGYTPQLKGRAKSDKLCSCFQLMRLPSLISLSGLQFGLVSKHEVPSYFVSVSLINVFILFRKISGACLRPVFTSVL